MSDYYIYLQLPPYLRQWFVHRHGGHEPVNLRRGSIESLILQRATMPTPDGYIPRPKADGELAVCLPYSKAHDPRIYNYISDTGKKALADRIKMDFDMDVWDFLHDFGKINEQQKELINMFMEQRGIREDGSCWDAIAKIYQRKRELYLDRKKKQKSYTTKKSILEKI